MSENPRNTRRAALALITVLSGVASGVSGMLLGLLLRLVQHWAYGYSLQTIVGSESFLEGVSSASPVRRVLALTLCGMVAGFGWWALYRLGKPLTSIAKAVGENGPTMPFFSIIVDVFLQIITVALGSPLGREVAPRELGALLAGRLSNWAQLNPKYRRIMIACGAGAGLAAVYNVPLGGTLFTLEVLLGTFSLSALIPALAPLAIGCAGKKTTDSTKQIIESTSLSFISVSREWRFHAKVLDRLSIPDLLARTGLKAQHFGRNLGDFSVLSRDRNKRLGHLRESLQGSTYLGADPADQDSHSSPHGSRSHSRFPFARTTILIHCDGDNVFPGWTEVRKENVRGDRAPWKGHGWNGRSLAAACRACLAQINRERHWSRRNCGDR